MRSLAPSDQTAVTRQRRTFQNLSNFAKLVNCMHGAALPSAPSIARDGMITPIWATKSPGRVPPGWVGPVLAVEANKSLEAV